MILRGRLIPDTETPLDDGKTQPPPMRAKVRLADGRAVQAIIKRLPPRETAVECYCAELLSIWGIPTPPAALIDDGDGFIFASLDTGYPSLKKRLGITCDMSKPEQAQRAIAAGKLIKDWEEIPSVIAVDEAIHNRDRNLGNILWDGDTRSYIDHAGALDPTASGINMLAGLMFAAGAAAQTERAAVTACFTLAEDAINKATEDMPETWLEYKTEFATIVANRHHDLQQILLLVGIKNAIGQHLRQARVEHIGRPGIEAAPVTSQPLQNCRRLELVDRSVLKRKLAYPE